VDLGSYSSRVTLMSGNAAIQAAERARDLLASAAAARLGVPVERLEFSGRRVFDRDDPAKGLPFAEACVAAEAMHGTLGTTGSYRPPKSPARYKGAGVGPSPAYSYSACVVEVAVDAETGIVRVPKVWMAHDVGQCIHRALTIGQVEGGVYMGLGEALMEEMAYRGNRGVVHKFPSMLEYKSPTTHEMCEVETILIEDPDPNGPFGGKEVGQGPLLPIMPAVANAVYDAVGVRVDKVPISPPKVLKALQRKAAGQEPRFGPGPLPATEWPEPTRVVPPWEGGDGRDLRAKEEVGHGGVRGAIPGAPGPARGAGPPPSARRSAPAPPPGRRGSSSPAAPTSSPT
jgi:4-hydroxybenzoyl-CoA reductase subunit alpha